MKQIISFVLVTVLLISFMPIGLAVDELKVYVDEEIVEFDTPPMVIDNRTMVPVRAIAEALSISVQWSEEKQEVYLITESVIILRINNKMATFVSHIDKELEVAPFVKEGRTYVPLRFISECFNRNVIYDGENNTIHIDQMIQDGWYVDTRNNYKIRMFRDLEFGGRGFGIDEGKEYSYEISVTPFYTYEDQSMPVRGSRMSYRVTPNKEEFNTVLEKLVKYNSNKENYRIVEENDNSYLIYYEFIEEGSSKRHRKANIYIKYDGVSILVSRFNAIDDYYNKYQIEIIENLKSIQDIDKMQTTTTASVNSFENNNINYNLNK